MSMKNNLKIREFNGRILGKLDYTFIHNEDENWQDHKVKSDDILFPSHGQYMSSPVVISYIDKK